MAGNWAVVCCPLQVEWEKADISPSFVRPPLDLWELASCFFSLFLPLHTANPLPKMSLAQFGKQKYKLKCINADTFGLSNSTATDSVQFQFSSVTQSCLTLCDPTNCSTPGLPVHHQLPESTQIHVHRVSDAIQPSHPLSSPSSPALNSSQHQGLFK